MGKYLDNKGLLHFWDRIKGLNGDILAICDDIKKKFDDTIDVITGGVNYGESEDNFESALNAALNDTENSVIDMTRFTGNITCKSKFVIERPVTIKLGNARITMEDTNFFEIKSNNVTVIGVGRSSDYSTLNEDDNVTTLILNAEPENDCTIGYHIYSRGNKNCTFKNMNLVGVPSELGTQFDDQSNYPKGIGGIYIEKGKPEVTEGGNTCNNMIIEDILIDGTRTHGIYIDTPILSALRNIRLSNVAGHAIFINSGTSILMDNVYAASCNMSGFCLLGVRYSSLINCVAENCGNGIWLRGCANISILSPGIESTYERGNKPWKGSTVGFRAITMSSDGTEEIKIIDVPNDNFKLGDRDGVHGSTLSYSNIFHAYGIVLSGGKNINIICPYITDIDTKNQTKPNDGRLRFILVEGNCRSSRISNPDLHWPSSKGFSDSLKYEIEIREDVLDFVLEYNPTNTIMENYTSETPVTDDVTKTAPILNLSESTLITSGNKIFYGDKTHKEVIEELTRIVETDNVNYFVVTNTTDSMNN